MRVRIVEGPGSGMTKRAPRRVLEIGGEGEELERSEVLAARRRAREAATAQRSDPWGFEAGKWVESARRVLDAGPGPREHDFEEPYAGRGWYAREFIRLDELTRQQIDAGNAALAATTGARLGSLVTEAELKFMAEAAWRVGCKVMDGGEKGAAGRFGPSASRDVENAEIRRRVEAEEQALKRLGHDRPRMAALEAMAGELRCCVRTVARRIGTRERDA